MNRYTICLALWFGLSIFLSAQSKTYTLADTTFANTLLKESIDLNTKGKYEAAYAKADSSQLVFEQVLGKETKEVADALYQKARSKDFSSKTDEAIVIYEQSLAIRLKIVGNNNIDVAQSYNNLGLAYSDKQNFDKAIKYLENALNIRLKIFGNEHINVAKSYTALGNVYAVQDLIDKAIKYHEKALAINIKSLGMNSSAVAWSYNNLGNLFHEKDEYDKAIEYHQKALVIRLKIFGNTHIDVATSYNNLGNPYEFKGEHNKAINYFQKALDIRVQLLGLNHPDVAMSFNNLGFAFDSKGEYEKAINYYKKSLDIRLKTLGFKHLKVASSYKNIGTVYHVIEEYDKAIEYTQKGLDIVIEILGNNNPNVATFYFNLGRIYDSKGNYSEAINYEQKSLPIFTTFYGNNHSTVATIYNGVGMSYSSMKNYDKALEYYDKALEIQLKIFGERHKDVSMSYNNLGLAYKNKSDYDKSIPYLLKALKALNYTDKKDLNQINELKNLATILQNTSETYIKQYQITHQKQHLSQAVDYTEQAIAALNYQNKTLNTEGDKTQAKNQNYAVYEGAIQSSLLLANEDNNDTLRKTTFNYAEQSKAGILQAQIKEADALRFAGIPDSLLQREYDLRVDITWRDKQRQEKLNAGRSETDSTVLDISSKLFDLRQQYDTLKRQFERDYPQYYRLKYDLNTVNVAEVQQKLLTNDQTLLSYFVGDSSVFMFVVNKNKYSVQEIKKDSLDSLVKQLRSSMYDNQDATGDAYIQNAKNYTEIAYKLYEFLILPIKSQLQTNLIIVPDGVLGYIPFETLLTEKPETHFDYYQLHPYLLKDYNISYNYSATLWQEMKNRRDVGRDAINRVSTEGGLIAFAPTFGSDTKKDSLDTKTDFLATRSDPLKRLYHNIAEVQAIQKIIGGKVYTGNFATKETFLKEAAKYRIIHLATHGKADDRIGDYAFLAFQETKDSTDNGRLFVKDLYNCTLNADLVVLSACETGIGKWQRGEGIISLARAFAYAGTKSIVTTLWSIDDVGTKTLMTSFYKNLKGGQTKDAALRQAKLEYLNKNVSGNAAPFHWAAFIAIGDIQAIKK